MVKSCSIKSNLNLPNLCIFKVAGIELVEPDASIPRTWLHHSKQKIKPSVVSREVAAQLILDVDTLISDATKVAFI